MNLKELFDNNADCYTDVQKMNSKGAYDWTEEQAMTRDKFEEVVKKLILSSVSKSFYCFDRVVTGDKEEECKKQCDRCRNV